MRSRYALALAGASIASLLFFAPSPARANDRFPAANQIVFSPSNPSTIVARTTFGLLPSVDDGATWHWICEDVLALPAIMVADPEIALTAGGGLVAGTPAPYELGLSVSSDLGCNWGCAATFSNAAVQDVVLRSLSPHSVLAILGGSLGPDGGIIASQVYESKDDGATWAPLGTPFNATDLSLLASSIDVSATDPQRLYVTATRGQGPTRTASLYVSTDDAATWTEHVLADFRPGTEASIFVGAVDPMDPDRVYVRSAGTNAAGVSAYNSCGPMVGDSRLWVTSDAGGTFDPVDLPIACQILGFALSPDGSRVYAGSYSEGLFVASKSDLEFTKTSSIHVECLATRGNELWACSDAAAGFIVGVSTNEGACFDARLPLLTALAGPAACTPNPSGPRACMATDNASECTNAAFQALCSGPFAMSDNCFMEAGAPDGGCELADAAPPVGDGGATTPHATLSGGACGCEAVGTRGLGWFAAVGLASAIASATAMRRRRRD